MSDFDAIVVGSGMSGGWVAKELCERGLKVLVLERGKDIDPASDYSDQTPVYERTHLDRLTEKERAQHYPIQTRAAAYAVKESNKHLWVKDSDHPYVTPDDKPFSWVRGYHVGGRSLTWWRASFRLSPDDFLGNQRDGIGVDWPIRYDDLAPWYDHVERFAGVSGSREDNDTLPDGVFQPAFALTGPEEAFQQWVAASYADRFVTPTRTANLTAPTEEQQALGRGRCQVRSLCVHGCSYGAYFSANSATLPAAKRTGNLTLRTDAIVHSLITDAPGNRITGVRVIDAKTKEHSVFTSRILFLNASAIASALILLQSASDQHPDGLANSSDQVGRNVMDHVGGAYAVANVSGFDDLYTFGRRPNGYYMPRYTNVGRRDRAFLRGYGFQGNSWRAGWSGDRPGVGEELKEKNRRPGPWRISATAFGEVLPNPKNRVTPHKTKVDRWGLPLPYIDCQYGDNELALMQQASKDIHAMFTQAGFKVVESSETNGLKLWEPGRGIHEMGTARMGRDPSTSVLNRFNQAHDVENLFITDGAAMTSSATQNPSLTYMALSARAANHAADLLEQSIL
ncbi:MAG: GMC family oxidoreductase [Pseudomonadota bacterium]